MILFAIYLVLAAHLAWILFILFGFVFALKQSRIMWVHLGGLGFSLVLNLMGRYCPLTYLENYLYSLYRADPGYHGSFIAHYLSTLIYPDIPEQAVRAGEILFVLAYFFFYINLFRFRGRRPGAGSN